MNLDLHDILAKAIKYLVEGLAVAVAAYYIPKRKMSLEEILTIAVTAAATFAILDILAPTVGSSARHGAGIGIGATLTGATLPIPAMA